MTTYYICSKDIALEHCSGEFAKNVRYINDSENIIYSEHFGLANSECQTALLLKDINNDMILMLTLKDPIFRKIDKNQMSLQLLDYIKRPWGIIP